MVQDYYKDLEQKQVLNRKLEKALREKDDDELYKQMFELFGYEAPTKEDIKKKYKDVIKELELVEKDSKISSIKEVKIAIDFLKLCFNRHYNRENEKIEESHNYFNILRDNLKQAGIIVTETIRRSKTPGPIVNS